MALIEARLPDASDASTADAIEAVLFKQLTERELIKRVGTHHWIVGMIADAFSAQSFAERARQSVEFESRNRPQGQLPAIDFRINGTWRVPDGRERFLEHLSHRLREPTPRESDAKLPC